MTELSKKDKKALLAIAKSILVKHYKNKGVKWCMRATGKSRSWVTRNAHNLGLRLKPGLRDTWKDEVPYSMTLQYTKKRRYHINKTELEALAAYRPWRSHQREMRETCPR